ncbi:set domain containing protein [Niveomyces insectorum RCEF 264]|uniref:Set domain containing protein n=1 Tax=Niveomyces insectorum RCEF 264 TaxID=1081102 RepID=A0A167Z2K8_9HYPO|nr:set domain containing protein [Niveomyces insectorum RCEF 264]
MDDQLKELLRYAEKLDVRLDGITPRKLPGRGYGIVATRDLKEGELILEVPTRALRTLATVPKSLSRKLDHDVSVHGILAAHLMLDTSGTYDAWNAVLPTPDDLAEGMPLLWPRALQALLPTPAQDALARQQAKLQRDWTHVKTALELGKGGASDDTGGSGSGSGEDDYRTRYTRAWLLVNSRTFYYTTPRSEQTLPRHDDRLALQPVADLFNHTGDAGGGARATYGPEGFRFVADRAYPAGAEVPISYGAHANDALLVEYGFVLPGQGADTAANRRWDEVSLDAAILPRLATRAHRADLAAAGFLGRYMIDAATPGGCYRTQVALRRILCRTAAERAAWQRFVDGGGSGGTNGGNAGWHHRDRGEDGQDDDDDDEDPMQAQVDDLLRDCLADMTEVAETALASIARLGQRNVGSPAQRGLLVARWQQIEAMVAEAATQMAADAGARASEV